ncbi:MAG: PD-(D/E)XK nuclease family transposase [Solobacterium sp.]|nr:PD-(D/E)XK nuclease family transposase [Solobacterium sp.]
MTREEILRQMAALQTQLDELDKAQGFAYMSISLTEAEKEKQHQEDLQRLRGLRLIDDDFMNVCFDGYTDGAELLLRIILNKPNIRVKSVKTQRRMKNLLGRDICLDIDADDETGKEYNVEVQRADKGADRKRARYHSSILDAHLLQPGDDFIDLPETFVIFITENDVIGKGKPLYRIERRIEETNETFDDGEHIVYVNGADKDASTELGKLMHDFFCTDPDDMHYKELADKVRYFKEDEKGVAAMCKVMEDMRNESARDAKWKQVVESVCRWLSMGLSHEQIAKGEGITLEQVHEIANMKRA